VSFHQLVQEAHSSGVASGLSGDALLAHILTCARGAALRAHPLPTGTRSTPPGTLVTVRVMVQEIGSPEYFISEATSSSPLSATSTTSSATATTTITGFFRDHFDENEAVSEPVKLMERQPVYCVPVPGRSVWTGREVGTGAMGATEGRRGAKRHIDEGAMEEDEGELRGPASRAAPQQQQQQQQEQHPEQEGARAPVAPDLNFPLPGETGTPFLVKIYGPQAAEVRMCDVLDVVGVLSHGALESHGEADGDAGFDRLVDAEHHTLPAALVPRLHAISVTKVGCLHPYLPALGSPDREALAASMSPVAIAELRARVLGALAGAATQGDALAAEYVLLHLLSRTHASRMGVKVGRLSLNLHAKELDAAAIGEAYRALSPAAHVAPMSLDYLNNSRAAPVMDHSRNRLLSGLLQLPSSAFLLLDETAMTEGTLQARGIQNIQALSNAIRSGEVEYDYVFHKISMDADFVFAVLSQAPSKFLPCDVRVRLAATQPNHSPSQAWDSLAQGWLADARSYLALVRHLPFAVPEEVGKLITDDFVQARQENPQLDPQTLGLWLTLARLRAASFGESTLSEQRWRELRDLEGRRTARG
jgi:hypothetical protein